MRIINRRRLAALATTGVTLAATLGAAVVAAPAASAHGSYRHCTTSASLFAANNPDYSVAIPLGYDESHVTATCYLTNGDTGTGVRVLQRALNKCYSAGLTVDGVFGDLTEAALRRAQRATGATVDGEYGPNTRNHIGWPTYRRSTGQFVHCYKWSNIQWVMV
ncbi:peptidoglycan-binding domain-containing protein [Streptomyces sp. NPDC005009]